MSDLTRLLDQLDQAHAAATPGPWQVDDDGDELRVTAGSARTEWTEHDWGRLGVPPTSYRSTDLIHERDIGEWSGETEDDVEQRRTDAALIVAAVNALPRLTAALRAVADLADQYAFLGATIHDVPRAASWAEAAKELRAALALAGQEEGA